MEFYAMALKKKINIPDVNVRKVVRNGRAFLVGKYKVGSKEYEAWRALGKVK